MTATGHDAILLGPARRRPSAGSSARRGLAGGIQISASHNPPQYNGLKFFQRGGMVLGADQGRPCSIAGSAATSDGRAGTAWAGPAGSMIPIRATWQRARDRGSRGDPSARFKVVLDACHGAGGRLATPSPGALGLRGLVLGGARTGVTIIHPSRPRRISRNSRAIVPAIGAAIGFAQDPDADRLAIVDETGRYIGEELTLALAARRRLEQARGPVVINLSTSHDDRESWRRAGVARSTARPWARSTSSSG